jgi:hypothetical protein
MIHSKFTAQMLLEMVAAAVLAETMLLIMLQVLKTRCSA